MVGLTLPVGVGAVALLVVTSAFFSSSETAIFSLPRDWRSDRRDEAAAALGSLREDPHRLLVTILVGNNVVNVAISTITTVLCVAYLPPGWALTVATAVASTVVLVFGEIVPKAYGLGNAERWAHAVSRPLRAVELLLLPLVVVFDAVTRGINDWLGAADVEGVYDDD